MPPPPPDSVLKDRREAAFGGIAVSATDTSNIIWLPTNHFPPSYTKDRGRTWHRIVLPASRDANGLAWPLQLYTQGVDRRPDFGGVFLLSPQRDGGNAALAGLWRSEDGGANWHRIHAGEVAPQSEHSAKLRAVPGMAGHLFFTSGIGDGPDTRLRRSTNGGHSWQSLDHVTHVDDIAFGKAAPGQAYPAVYLSGRINRRYGIWRSIDAALTWQMIAEFPIGTLDQVLCDRSRQGFLRAGLSGIQGIRVAVWPARELRRGFGGFSRRNRMHGRPLAY